MFSLFRRTHVPAPAPTSPAPLMVADAAVAERADRIRAAWTEAGGDLSRLTPAPAWLEAARTGTPVLLSDDDRQQVLGHLGTSPFSLASDTACEAVVREIELHGLWRDLRAEGIEAVVCGPVDSPEFLREVLASARADNVKEWFALRERAA
ncbi:hypothetical protein ACFYVL_43000 [Streptomyces sp. NPDC004111]|uniref:hypothetical protein n=1 Tax=Streptomyces sp. NPDC004111 TaxID=3364690 RepID=UPI00368D0BC2